MIYRNVLIWVKSKSRKERLTFSNQWEALEFQIKKQDDEIERLKNTQKVIIIKKHFTAFKILISKIYGGLSLATFDRIVSQKHIKTPIKYISLTKD